MSTQAIDDSTGFDEPTEIVPTATTKAQLAITDDMGRIKNAVGEFDRVSAGLAAIAEAYPKDAVYDVTTTKGMKAAIEHRAAWRDPRITVEKVRKMAKAPLIALGKNIDARAAWITEQLLEGEEPMDQQIKAEEARKEAEREAKAAAEFGRVLAIQEALAEIATDVAVACGKTSADISALLALMQTTQPDLAVFQEMMEQAKAAWAAGITKLETSHKAKLWEEAEGRRVAAEAEAQREAARIAAENLARQRVENERIAAEQQAERDRMAAERAEFERQKAELQAEKDRIAAEAQAKADQAARLEREQREEAERQARELEADRERAEAAEAIAAQQNFEAQGVRHVLKAEAETPDATDRDVPAISSPSVGSMGAGKAADAAPLAAHAPEVRQIHPAAQAMREQPTMTLGQISTRLGFTVTAEFLAGLGFEAHKERASRLYRPSAFDDIARAISDHCLGLVAKKAA